VVSIVVPVYNSAAFLDEAVQSVLAQTFSEWELLLVDDGSTDESPILCQRYAEQDQRIFYHRKENGGQASARNLGISKARFGLIAFLDSDDRWLQDKLEIQLQEMITHHAGFVYAMVKELLPGNGPDRYQERDVKLHWKFGFFSGEDFFKQLYTGSGVTCSSVLVEKKLLDEAGGFDENPVLRGVEDWDLWLRICKTGMNVYGSEKVLVHYRIHGAGVHHQMVRMFTGKKKVYEKYDNDPRVPRLARLRQYRYVYRELMNYLAAEDRYDLIPETVCEFRQKDYYGWATVNQFLWVRILNIPAFLRWSKLLYYPAYWFEKIQYALFLSKDFR
jgi:teichuronic acid biosynthesis glycosyltransferase TuaG